jgi:hypothetical protein
MRGEIRWYKRKAPNRETAGVDFNPRFYPDQGLK